MRFDELGRLAGAGRRLDDERVVEVVAIASRAACIGFGSRLRASWRRSWPLPQRFEIAELLGRLVARRGAARPGRTPGRKSHQVHARRRGAAGRKPSSIARSTISSASRPMRRFVLVERDLVIDEPAGRRCSRTGGPDCTGRLQRLLDRQAVEHRLQDRAAADHRLPGRPVLAGLVIGDAEIALAPPVAPRSIRSTEPRSLKRPSISTGSGTLRGSRAVVVAGQAERELEIGRHPAGVRRRRPGAGPRRAGRGRCRRSRRATRDRSRARDPPRTRGDLGDHAVERRQRGGHVRLR